MPDMTPAPSLTAPDADMAMLQSELQDDKANTAADVAHRDQESSSLSRMIADFNPDAATGPRPTFDDPVPQEHFADVMKQAPLLMGLAAIGGAFGKIHGMAMLQSTNAMMKGLISGSDKQYKEAREKYDQDYNQYIAKSRMWSDVYRAYTQAYKGSIDAQQRAVAAANAAVGIDQRQEKMTQDQIAKRLQLNGMIEKINAQIARWNHQNMTDAIKAAAAQTKADAAASGKSGARGGDEPLSERAKQLQGELSLHGVAIPSTARSKQLQVVALNSIVSEHPDKTPAQLAEEIRGHSLKLRADQASALMLGRKEAAVASGFNALVRPNGIFDQLDATASKINFGDLKVISQLKLLAQGHAVADPTLQAYKTLIEEARTELTQVLSRTGVPSDAVRRQTEEMLPLKSSYAELKASIQASKLVAQSVSDGNEATIAAIAAGKPMMSIAHDLGLPRNPANPNNGYKKGDRSKDKNGKVIEYDGNNWVYPQ